ncbi:MAG TPA: hypothetical protein VFQ39_02795, partial [Longimicrobium sp.]|nr:hypothetical protein [Longimicrobium sp.]
FVPGQDDEPAPLGDVELFARFAADLTGAEPAAVEALRGELRELPAEEREAAVGAWIARTAPEVPVPLVAQVGRTVRVWSGVDEALRGWSPPRYDGDVLFLQAAEATPGIETPPGGLAAGWEAHVGGRMEVRVVPGTHATMVLEPAVEAVAREIREALAGVPAE